MLPSQTVGVSIDRGWQEVYEAIWRPECFPRWASGLSASPLQRDGDVWRAQGPDGPVTIRFTPHNPFGVMDHVVDTGRGAQIYVPLRIVANDEGAAALLTLFRQPGVSDEAFSRDVAWVERDLAALRSLVVG